MARKLAKLQMSHKRKEVAIRVDGLLKLSGDVTDLGPRVAEGIVGAVVGLVGDCSGRHHIRLLLRLLPGGNHRLRHILLHILWCISLRRLLPVLLLRLGGPGRLLGHGRPLALPGEGRGARR